MNATMVYLGGDQLGSATAAARLPSVLVLAVVSLALAGALYSSQARPTAQMTRRRTRDSPRGNRAPAH